ncbi:MAG: VCBS repeat-containing protein, partial [Deltaproteobacteria bacterium]
MTAISRSAAHPFPAADRDSRSQRDPKNRVDRHSGIAGPNENSTQRCVTIAEPRAFGNRPRFSHRPPIEDRSPAPARHRASDRNSHPSASDFPDTLMQVAWSSGEAGTVRDFDGDGIPDRLAAVNSGTNGSGAYYLFRGRSPDAFGAFGWDPAIPWLKAFPSLEHPSPSVSVLTGRADSDALGYERIDTDLAIDANGDGLPDLVSGVPVVVRDGSRPNGIRVGIGTTRAFINFGLGFDDTGRYWLPPGIPLGHTKVGPSDPALGCPINRDTPPGEAVHCFRPVSRDVHVVDFNGDGLVDIVGRDWWLPNTGSGWASPASGRGYALPSLGAGVAFTGEGREEGERGDFQFWTRTIVDINGDGRPDIVQVRPPAQGVPAQLEIITDTDMHAAPGRLRTIDNGRGARDFSNGPCRLTWTVPEDA